MKIEENDVITHFYLDANDEVELLNLFLSNNEHLLFACSGESFIPDKEEGLAVPEDVEKYIKDRTVEISEEKINEWYPFDDDVEIYWYLPKNKNELIKEIEDNYYDYLCVVVEKGKKVSDYTYLLRLEENYPFEENNDCRALIIYEKSEGDFKAKVLPKINERFKEIGCKRI